MKKILATILCIMIIPYLIVTLFIADDEVKFSFKKDQVIRVKQSSGNLISLPFEEYVTGVLSGEMPVSFSLEALKAQAVAARSYALVRISQNKNSEYDVVDTVMNQVYLDENALKQKWGTSYEANINKVKMAVVETKGQYLDYNGNVVEAFFFSTSTGKTENVEEVFSENLPYLRSVDSSFDKEVSPVFEDSVTYSFDDFCNSLNIAKTNPLQIEVLETTSTGRIKKIKINGQEFTGNEVANKLKLRSSYFSITQNETVIVISTKGYGHGVGMSQVGANYLAGNGDSCEDIIKYYYTGVDIITIE